MARQSKVPLAPPGGSIGCTALTKVWLRTSWAVSSFTSSRGPACLERTDENGASLSGSASTVLPSASGNGPPRQPDSDDDQEERHLQAQTVLLGLGVQCTRAFLVELAESVLRDDLLDEAVTVAAQSFPNCYVALSSGSVFAKDVLRGSSVKFTQQLVALESVDPGCWGLKPTLHLWLELCASGASPSLFWTYRDEDFGGTCALGTQERRASERHCHFQGLARPCLDQGACATLLSSWIFSAQSCFSFCFHLHKQCSGVAPRLFGNTPLTAGASKCLPISHCHH